MDERDPETRRRIKHATQVLRERSLYLTWASDFAKYMEWKLDKMLVGDW
jgi:hypothetical protein